MPSPSVSKEDFQRLTLALKEYEEKQEKLSVQMHSLELSLTRQEAQGTHPKVEAMEARVRLLESKADGATATFKAVWAIISLLGVGGIVAVLKFFSK